MSKTSSSKIVIQNYIKNYSNDLLDLNEKLKKYQLDKEINIKKEGLLNDKINHMSVNTINKEFLKINNSNEKKNKKIDKINELINNITDKLNNLKKDLKNEENFKEEIIMEML